MIEKPASFCFYGKCFEDEQGFWEHVRRWPSLPVDLEEIQQMLDMTMSEIKMNNEMREGKLSNREAFSILRHAIEGIEYEEEE